VISVVVLIAFIIGLFMIKQAAGLRAEDEVVSLLVGSGGATL
jgi:hypothetical protein